MPPGENETVAVGTATTGTSTPATGDVDAALEARLQERLQQERERIEAEVRSYWENQNKDLSRRYDQESKANGEKRRKAEETVADLEAKVKAAEISGDALKLAQEQARLTRAERELQEREDRTAARERDATLKEMIADMRAAHPGVPAAFWTQARERLLAGEPSYRVAWDAAAQAQGNGKEQPAPKQASGGKPPITTGAPQGGGASTSRDQYKQALQNGGKLPPAAEIDALTADFLSRHQ